MTKQRGYSGKRFYGGFVDGKLDYINCDTGWGGFGRGEEHYPIMPALFKTRQAAHERYEDVRPIFLRATKG